MTHEHRETEAITVRRPAWFDRLLRFVRRRRRLRNAMSKDRPFVPHRDENLESYSHVRHRQRFDQL